MATREISSKKIVQVSNDTAWALSEPDLDNSGWAVRNERWLALHSQKPGAKGKRPPREPLILCGHGVALKVDKGTLLIRDGFTHWPQERAQYRLFKGAPNLPSRVVMLDGSGSLTFDVMAWLSEQSIPLVHLNYQGDVVSVIGGDAFARDPEKVRWQVETRADPERRIDFCCDLVVQKLTAGIVTLRSTFGETPARQTAIAHAESGIYKLRSRAVNSVPDILIIEATSAAAYFRAWQGISLNWRSKSKYPVPEHWWEVQVRNKFQNGRWRSSRNAKHPMNAMLNYAYGMLRSRIHIGLVADGYDPRKGIMHHERDDSDAFAFVFDMMEPHRSAVDAALMRFVRTQPLTGADFVLRSDGVCRLAPQLARRVAAITEGVSP